MPSLLGISARALLSFQQGMNTTGHNIANVNTPGYSRQRVNFSNTPPEFSGFGYLGSGVQVDSVERIYDRFVVEQVRNSQSAFNEQQAYFNLARQIDNLLGDSASGLSPSLQAFFNGVQEVANDPTSTSARQVMRTEGENLVARFQQLDQRLGESRARANEQIRTVVTEINDYATTIASLNEDIASAWARSGGKPPNDLLDQRDATIERLAELISVSTLPQQDGMVNVFVGNGQSLVLGTETTTLVAAPMSPDPDHLDIGFVTPSGPAPITNIVSGGKLSGLFEFRDNVLDPAHNALGRIAIGLTETFNQQHRLGMDLDGNAGQDFFSVPQAQVIPDSGNAGSGPVVVGLDDVSQLTLEDYRLNYDGASWALTRSTDGQSVAFASGSGSAADPYLVDGISIQVDPAAAAGDTYLIRPTRLGAATLGVALSDNRQIAAADPSAGPGGVGDNRNALKLADLQHSLILANGTASISGAYTTLVADVGTYTRQAQLNVSAQEGMLEQAQAERESISGVNLDEEAAKLLKYQQAYQAAAQVIATADLLFKTLIDAVRG